MIELHDNACIRIDDTFAILGTVEGMANLTGAKPQELAANYRARRMALVWTTIAPAITPGRSGHLERQNHHDNAIKLRNGQAVKIEGRFYTVALTSGRPSTIRLIPHDLDEPGAPNMTSRKPILIRFSRGTGWEGAIVRWVTWSWAAHVGFRLPDGRVLDATPQFGVSIRIATDYDTSRYFLPRAPQDLVRNAVACAAQQVGKPYDWTAIFGMVVRRDWHKPDKWFCSELIDRGSDVRGVMRAAE